MRSTSVGKPAHAHRRWLRLVVGVVSGLVVGFGLGLARPRARTS